MAKTIANPPASPPPTNRSMATRAESGPRYTPANENPRARRAKPANHRTINAPKASAVVIPTARAAQRVNSPKRQASVMYQLRDNANNHDQRRLNSAPNQ